MDKHTKKEEVVLGTNSDIISEQFKNYKHKVYDADYPSDLSKIPFDLDNLDRLDGNIWSPTETDKKYMSQNGYDEATADAKKRREKLIFTNTFVNYDSCDCGGDYPCSHGDFPYEIEIKNKEGKIEHVIEIDGNGLELGNMETNISIYGLKNFTYADFYRFCQLCDITLESKFILK